MIECSGYGMDHAWATEDVQTSVAGFIEFTVPVPEVIPVPEVPEPEVPVPEPLIPPPVD